MPSSLQIPPYRAALLTGADGAPVIRSNGPDSELVMTERQWYLFWQNLAGQVTANVQTLEGLENIATYGNHADRPDPGPWPDGALYVEQDRGSVLYQNQGGIWVYIAGQMFGTLSPDQRPTDLGPAADVGFLFRTSVDPARSFAWNGGQWVETTPARYGTHAARLAAPVADMVSGMLWIETDRGNAIYQNQAGTWLLLTGTMWGTLSPDQRPTDLGVNDAGFTFLSTTTPPRQFIWSSTAWVDVTPAAQTPWTQNIDGAGFNLTNTGRVGIANPTPLNALDIGTAGFNAFGGVHGTVGNTAGNSGFNVGQSNANRGRMLWFYNASAAAAYIAVESVNGTNPMVLQSGGGNVAIGSGLTAPIYQLQLPIDSAAKPVSSTWSVPSDLRLKQNVELVTDDSLAILDAIEWIRYEYNGLANMPKGAKGIGAAAQALRAQMPEAVRGTKTRLAADDAEETDLLAIDYHYVLVHSARAIRQLSAEVKRLGALLGKPA